MAQDAINITGGVSAPQRSPVAPRLLLPRPRSLETGETASADEKSDDLLIKVVTGEEDADASDPTAFDDEHLGEFLDTQAPAAATGATAPSLESPSPPPPKAESASGGTSEQPVTGPAGLEEGEQSGPHIKDNRVILNENPDWSLVAEVFTAFIPVRKTIADIEGTEVRYRALSGRSRGLRWTSASDP